MPSCTRAQIAGTIDHSLLRPELLPSEIEAGVKIAREHGCASVCCKPCDVPLVAKLLAGSKTAVSTVVGFPHGSNTTETKVAEAEQALKQGCTELDMVLNIGWLRAGDRDSEIEADVRAVCAAAHAHGAKVKVIFENAYLNDEQKIRACKICEAAGADWVKTSTGFASPPAGVPTGATPADLRLMRAHVSPAVQVKAAGGIRTLDALLEALACGITRCGATATVAILTDFEARLAAQGKQPGEALEVQEAGAPGSMGAGY